MSFVHQFFPSFRLPRLPADRKLFNVEHHVGGLMEVDCPHQPQPDNLD